MIKLYDFLPCPFGQKVRIVLAEKSLSYELAALDITRGEHRRPEFLRLNPYGKVPVLVDEDTVVYDSTIINEYIDDEYPDPPMLPPIEFSSLRAPARGWERGAGWRGGRSEKTKRVGGGRPGGGGPRGRGGDFRFFPGPR